jgi:polyisoprenoid-binding protein YceI
MSEQRSRWILSAAVALTLFGGGSLQAAEYLAEAQSGNRLTFNAEQQGAEFQGRFEKFSARLVIDVDQPDSNCLEATIDLNSVNTEYQERDDYLRGEEWFNVAKWPTAKFITRSLKAVGEGRYLADAELTLRDVTHPVPMEFSFDGQHFSGRAKLDRRVFGVGQGMWEDERMVGAEVTVDVDIVFEPVN